MSWDVAIIGGGPAGATLGGLLAKQGRRVLIAERAEFPRFHIGESLLPQSCPVFEKLGVMDRLCDSCTLKYGATFVDAPTGRMARYRFAEAFDARHEHAFQVRRSEFDALLLDKAREHGAEVRQPCKATEVIFEDERAAGVRLDSGETERARIVVDATGRGALLATRFSRRSRIPLLDHSSIFAHYRGVARPEGEAGGDVIVVLFDHGWFWQIPFQDGETSVGVVADREFMKRRDGADMAKFFDEAIDSIDFTRRTMRRAERITDVRTAADFSYRVDEIIGEGWLCVGDAFGFIDPLFSSGVHLALKSAEIASEAIEGALSRGDTSRAAFEPYEQKMRRASQRFVGVVQATYHGELREMLFAEKQRTVLRKLITSILSGDVVHDEPAPAWLRFAGDRFRPKL